jgi:hypothetical protein
MAKSHTKPSDWIGRTFDYITVLGPAPFTGKPGFVHCECQCGKQWLVLGAKLKNGNTTSCGCKRTERVVAMNSSHRMSRSPEYKSWAEMRQRCLNPKNPRFHHYGGRGISVCPRWLESFGNFFADMGLKPSSAHTLDRIDVNGNYDPSNCRWATWKQQQNNRRDTVLVEHRGEIRSVTEWSEATGIAKTSLSRYVSNGLSIAESIGRQWSRRRARRSRSG